MNEGRQNELSVGNSSHQEPHEFANEPLRKALSEGVKQVDPLFQVHLLNEQGIARAQSLAICFNDLLTDVKVIIEPSGVEPQGREYSLVRTHLELAGYYAKKSMANVPANQK